MLRVPGYSGHYDSARKLVPVLAGDLKHAVTSYQQRINHDGYQSDEILDNLVVEMKKRAKRIENTRDRLKRLDPEDDRYKVINPKTKKPKFTLEEDKENLEKNLFYELVYGDRDLEWFGIRSRAIYNGEDIYLTTKKGKGRFNE